LPEENKYVIKNLPQKVDDSQSWPAPKRVLRSSTAELWFKTDSKFNIPRAYICVNFLTNLASKSIKNQVMMDMLLFATAGQCQGRYSSMISIPLHHFLVMISLLPLKLESSVAFWAFSPMQLRITVSRTTPVRLELWSLDMIRSFQRLFYERWICSSSSDFIIWTFLVSLSINCRELIKVILVEFNKCRNSLIRHHDWRSSSCLFRVGHTPSY